MSDDRLPALRTSIVEGPLAFQMRRFTAAEINDWGLHILNLPQVAARLAGGFTIAASVEQLEPAIQEALDEGGFVELERVRHLPGMARAVLRTLRKIWAADFDLAAAGCDRHRRILEMSLIEARLKSRLPQAVMMPRNLRDAALKRIRHAPRILGEIRIEGISFIAPRNDSRRHGRRIEPRDLAAKPAGVCFGWRDPLDRNDLAKSLDQGSPDARALAAAAGFLRGLAKSAEQLTRPQKWRAILSRAFQAFLNGRPLRAPPWLAPI